MKNWVHQKIDDDGYPSEYVQYESLFVLPEKFFYLRLKKNHSQNDLIYKKTLNLTIKKNDLKMKNQKLTLVNGEGWWETEYTDR